MTAIEDFKKDRQKIIDLRVEDNTLSWKIDRAEIKSKHEGALDAHDYRDTWDIIHPKSGEPFKAHSHWFNRFGTDEEKEKMTKRRREIELSICAEDRHRRKDIDVEIKKIYDNYTQLFHGLEFGYCEGRRCDGENDIVDLMQVAINTLTFAKQGVEQAVDDAIDIIRKDAENAESNKKTD